MSGRGLQFPQPAHIREQIRFQQRRMGVEQSHARDGGECVPAPQDGLDPAELAIVMDTAQGFARYKSRSRSPAAGSMKNRRATPATNSARLARFRLQARSR